MAGSYHHLRDAETGLFRFDLIENLRDAYEACAQCFFLIEVLTEGDARRLEPLLDQYYRAKRGEAVSEEVGRHYRTLRYGWCQPFPTLDPFP